MKKIGLIGGLSWHSSMVYYQRINEEINQCLGGQSSAEIILNSLNFEEILCLWRQSDWDSVLNLLINAAQELEAAGADFFLICCNTVHQLANQLIENVTLPLLNIGEVVSANIRQQGFSKVGLLGTQAIMQSNVYSDCLSKQNIELLLPSPKEQTIVDQLILSEFTAGQITQTAIEQMNKMIDSLTQQGAQAVILGCTELPALIPSLEVQLPLIDTLELHVLAAVDKALN